MKIALCLLTRNELPCLKACFSKIPRPGVESGYDELWAIDGGSTDGTVEFYKENDVPVISQTNRGRGDAFHEAFKNIEADAYIFFSPDGNEEFEDIKKFKPLLEDGADIVIASRMMPESHNEEDDQLFRWRKWANLSFNMMANTVYRDKKTPFVTDSINGFRAITKKAANELKLDAFDYTIEYQMTIRAMKHGLKIVEFPTYEGQRIAGDTGAPSIPTGIRFIKRFFAEL